MSAGWISVHRVVRKADMQRSIASSRLPGMPSSVLRWYLLQYGLLLASASSMLWLFEHTDLDRQVAWLLFDRQTGEFVLQRNAFVEVVFHKGIRVAVHCLALSTLIPCWFGWKGRLAWLPPRNALLAALGMYAIPLVISTLKQITNCHCPWSVTDFGGSVPYLHLWQSAPPGLEVGKCFPAGHASVGFLWIVWAVALRPAGLGHARVALLAGLGTGALLGGLRMAQGAHFLSHTLASLWLAWLISVTLALLLHADVRLPGRAALEVRTRKRSVAGLLRSLARGLHAPGRLSVRVPACHPPSTRYSEPLQ